MYGHKIYYDYSDNSLLFYWLSIKTANSADREARLSHQLIQYFIHDHHVHSWCRAEILLGLPLTFNSRQIHHGKHCQRSEVQNSSAPQPFPPLTSSVDENALFSVSTGGQRSSSTKIKAELSISAPQCIICFSKRISCLGLCRTQFYDDGLSKACEPFFFLQKKDQKKKV